MNKIETTYYLTVSDYRQACYYGAGVRQYKSLRILFFIVGAALISFFGGTMWNWARGVELAALLGLIAALWLLSIFTGVEKGIRRYLKAPDAMIGCEYTVTLESHRITVKIPERKIHVSVKMNELVAVFALSREFMIYTTPQDTYLLPFRALTKGQLEEAKENFRHHLGEKYSETKRKFR